MALDAALMDELGHVCVSPMQNGQEHFDVLFLRAVESAHRRLFVSLGSLGRFRASDALHGAVEHLVFLQLRAAEPPQEVRESFRLNDLCKRLAPHDLHAVLHAVLDGAWRVDGRILVDGSVLDARHSCKFQYHVRILAAAVRHLNRLVAVSSSRAQQPQCPFDFLLQRFVFRLYLLLPFLLWLALLRYVIEYVKLYVFAHLIRMLMSCGCIICAWVYVRAGVREADSLKTVYGWVFSEFLLEIRCRYYCTGFLRRLIGENLAR